MTNQENDELNKTVGQIVIALSAIPFGVVTGVYRGWVMSKMWGWFVTAVFGVSVPSVALCIGLTIMVSYLFHPQEFKKKTPDQERREYGLFSRLALSCFATTFVLAFAWLVHLFA